jgi:predicted transport protein
MPLFKIADSKLKSLEAKSFKLEIDLQKLVDKNLKEIFGLDFIRTEFGGQGLSIDTIAFDPETKAPVLIEYKRDQQDTVVDQGIAYLKWLLEHKGDYKVELMEKVGKKEIDWSQARVIFIARNFNKYHIQAAAFKDLPIELWRYDWYNDFFYLEKIETPQSEVSIKSVVKTKEAKKVSEEIKTYTIEDHLKKANEKTGALFEILHEKISTLDNRIQTKAVSWYVAFKVRYHNFVFITLRQSKLRVYLRINNLDDPKKLFKIVPAKWGWGKTKIWFTDIDNDNNVDYIFSLIKQAYKVAPDL